MWPSGKLSSLTATLLCISFTRCFSSLSSNVTKAKITQCCLDLVLEADSNAWGQQGGLGIVPPSCLEDGGCGCPVLGLYISADDLASSVPEEDDALSLVEASATGGTVDGCDPLAACTGNESHFDHFEWGWVTLGYVISAACIVMGLCYAATLALRQGDDRVFDTDPMSYPRRLLAVSTLLFLCGGGTVLAIVCQLKMAHEVWRAWGDTGSCVFEAIVCVGFLYMVMGPLPYRKPSKSPLLHAIFALWREYFGFTYIVEDVGLMEALAKDTAVNFLLAQLPHGIMPFGAILGTSVSGEVFPGIWPISGVVATALLLTPVLRTFVNLLGVRKAGTRPIEAMFRDEYRGVGVVTGGIAEMFVSKKRETLTSLRKNFGRIALKGGHAVVPVFVFGASRTHKLLPGVDNRATRALSRKLGIPVLGFMGAFLCVPHRQKLTMIVGRPIVVEKIAEPTDAQALDVCDSIEAKVLRMYAKHRPDGETRRAHFER